MLDSVLFAICVTRHTSTGTSPFRLMFNKDPILPFKYADRNDNLVHETTECNVSQPIDEDRNPLFELIERMETQHENLFDRAKNKIQKSQEHQAKWYNMCNGAGEPFEIGSKVLCKNMKQLGHKSKLFKRFTGPYIMVGHCSTGSVYLKDCFSHWLQCAVAPNQLIWFNEHSKYGISDDGTICNAGSSDEAGCSGSESSDTVDNTVDSTCQRARFTNYGNPGPKTSTPVKSKQIIIVSSQEQPVSSDESVTIDVVDLSPMSPVSPKVSNLNNIPLDEMSIEIVDDLNDEWQTGVENCKPPVRYFNPLTDID